MAFNKWGSRVQEILDRRNPEPTIQEKISAAAEEAEIMETCRLLAEWFVRKARGYQGCTVEVMYDFPMDWYEVTISYATFSKNHKEINHHAFAQIRAEDVANEAVDVASWSRFLKGVYERLTKTLANSVRASGGDPTTGGDWYEAGKGRPRYTEREMVELPYKKRAPGLLVTWDVPAPVSKDEEAEAIASIRKAMGSADH